MLNVELMKNLGMMDNMTQIELDTNPTDIDTTLGEPRVILFNDNIHTFDEVINQCIKAIGCSKDQGQKIAMEVHTTGKSCVFQGKMVECIKISSILEEITLHTQIEV